MGCEPLSEITLVFVSGQDPGRFVDIYDEDKIELFDAVWMVEIVIRRQVKISNDLISSAVTV